MPDSPLPFRLGRTLALAAPCSAALLLALPLAAQPAILGGDAAWRDASGTWHSTRPWLAELDAAVAVRDDADWSAAWAAERPGLVLWVAAVLADPPAPGAPEHRLRSTVPFELEASLAYEPAYWAPPPEGASTADALLLAVELRGGAAQLLADPPAGTDPLTATVTTAWPGASGIVLVVRDGRGETPVARPAGRATTTLALPWAGAIPTGPGQPRTIVLELRAAVAPSPPPAPVQLVVTPRPGSVRIEGPSGSVSLSAARGG